MLKHEGGNQTDDRFRVFPTTLVRRLISLLMRSRGFVLCSFERSLSSKAI
jgi:hypothetical protein